MPDSQHTVNGVSRDKILHAKQEWVEARRKEGVEGVYKAQAMSLPLPPLLHDALRVPRAERAVIAILDRRRFIVSGGDLANWDPAARARRLGELGVTALMICSDECAHDGGYQDILHVAQTINLPIVCGDFVIDSVQVTMARAHGAAAVVLSSSLLSDRDLKRLYRTAVQLHLDVIVDVAAAKHVDSAKRIRVGQGPTGVPRLFGADILSLIEPDIRRLHERVAPAFPEESLSIACFSDQTEFSSLDLENLGYEAFIVDGSIPDLDSVDAHIREVAGELGEFAADATYS